MWKTLSVRWERVRSFKDFAVAFHLCCAGILTAGFLGLWHLLSIVRDSGGPRVSVLASGSVDQTVCAFVGLVCMACFVSTLAASLVVWCVVCAIRARQHKAALRGKAADESWCWHATRRVESLAHHCAVSYVVMTDDYWRGMYEGHTRGAIELWEELTAGGVSFDERRRVRGLFDFHVRRFHELEVEEESESVPVD